MLVASRIGYDVSRSSARRSGTAPAASFEGGRTFTTCSTSVPKRENMTLRDLYNLTAAARGHWVVCGTPETIADTLEEWFVEGAADGYNVLPPYFPGAFDDFVDLVVPELQRPRSVPPGLRRHDFARPFWPPAHLGPFRRAHRTRLARRQRR